MQPYNNNPQASGNDISRQMPQAGMPIQGNYPQQPQQQYGYVLQPRAMEQPILGNPVGDHSPNEQASPMLNHDQVPQQNQVGQPIYNEGCQQGYPMGQPNQMGVPGTQPYMQQGGHMPQGVPVQPMEVNMMFVPPEFSRYSQQLMCNFCHRQVQTVVDYKAGSGTCLVSCMIAAVGFWLGCCLIPCCMEDCKDAVHYCPSCSHQLAKRKFLFE